MDSAFTLSFRRMESSDLEQVVALDRLSFSLPWPVSSFKFEIEDNQVSRCWVAETVIDGGETTLVGMIVVWLIEDEVHVATIAVHPDYRRLKIAQRMLAFALIDAYHSGATRSFLEVRKGNQAARALYEGFGFKEVGTRKGYYKDNHEDAVMLNLEDMDLKRLKTLQ